MSSESSSPSSLEVLSQLSFPLDGVTLRAMRKNEPGLIDLIPGTPSDAGRSEVLAAHRFECELALRAAGATSATPSQKTDMPREEIVAVLSRVYVKFGLSDGLRTSRELIRDFERKAAELGSAKDRRS